MFKCPKYMMATAVAMALGGFAIAEDANQGTTGPGKTSGSPVSDRGTDASQNPAGGERAGQTGSQTGTQTTNSQSGMGAQTGTSATAGMHSDQTAQQIRQFASQPDTAGDRLFTLGAGMGNLWEVEFSRLVEERAQDQQVKDLAKMVRQDHEQANQKLQSVAQNLNVQLASRLPEEKQATLEVFRAMPVEQLEKCYLGMAKAGHAKDIINYQIHQTEAKDQGLKQYVSDVLPKLQEHGQHVQQVASAKGIQGGDITSLANASGTDRNVHTPGMTPTDSNSTGAGANTRGSGMGPGSTETGTSGTGTPTPGTASRQE